jgi:hypothetical protein
MDKPIATPARSKPKKAPATWRELEQLSSEEVQRFILKELQSISANIRFMTVLIIIGIALAVFVPSCVAALP